MKYRIAYVKRVVRTISAIMMCCVIVLTTILPMQTMAESSDGITATDSDAYEALPDGEVLDYTATESDALMDGIMPFLAGDTVDIHKPSGILEQSDFGDTDTTYVISENLNINGAGITLPSGCALRIDDGSIYNGSIDMNGGLLEGIDESVLCNIANVGNAQISAALFRDTSAADDATWVRRAMNCGAAIIDGCTISNQNSEIEVPSGITIQNFVFDCSGASSSFSILTPEQNTDGTSIKSCSFIGNGHTDGTNQAGFAMASGHNMRNIVIEDCSFSELRMGVSFNAENGGDIYDCRVSGCSFDHIRGTLPGYGYGLHDNNGHNTIVEDCTFDNCERHAVYFACSYNSVMRDCTVTNHRSEVAYDGDRSAVQIARGSHDILVEDNEFYNCCDSVIQISGAVSSAELDGELARNYKVYNNTFTATSTTRQPGFIMIGTESMLSGDVYGAADIDIYGNTFNSGKSEAVMIIWQARDSVYFRENTVNVVSGQTNMFQLFRLSRGEDDAPYTYITDNHFVATESVNIMPSPVRTYTDNPSKGFCWSGNTKSSNITWPTINTSTGVSNIPVIYTDPETYGTPNPFYGAHSGSDIITAKDFCYGVNEAHMTSQIALYLAGVSATDQDYNNIPMTDISADEAELSAINAAIDSMASEEGALGEYPLTIKTVGGSTRTINVTLRRYGAGSMVSDHITGTDFYCGIYEWPSNSFKPHMDENTVKLRAQVQAVYAGSGATVDIEDITVDAGQLATLNSRISSMGGGVYPLTFYSPDSTPVTVNVKIQTNAYESDMAPGSGALNAWVCYPDYNIGLGEMTGEYVSDALFNDKRSVQKQTSTEALDKYGNKLGYEDMIVNQNDLNALNQGIRDGDVGNTYSIRISVEDGAEVRTTVRLAADTPFSWTDGHTGTAGSVPQKNIGLGTSIIQKPTRPTSYTTIWNGSHVYYGSYNGNPLLYRVLDPDTVLYGGTHTMLLDSSTVVDKIAWDDDGITNLGQSAPSAWDHSDLQTWMNGSESGQFLEEFTLKEQSAIADSKKYGRNGNDGAFNSGETSYNFSWGVLNGDKVFPLDILEARNANYGYVNYWYGTDRCKDGNTTYYWLRSPVSTETDKVATSITRSDISGGRLTVSDVDMKTVGASPAMNISKGSILLSSAIGMNKTSAMAAVGSNLIADNTWKLTLIDNTKTLKLQTGASAIIEGSTITVPYVCTGSDITQLSVMITDGAYNAPDKQILYYGAIASSPSNNGLAYITLPSGLPSGYKIYIMAEDVNGTYETDYASEPLEIIPETPSSHTITIHVIDSANQDLSSLVTPSLLSYEVAYGSSIMVYAPSIAGYNRVGATSRVFANVIADGEVTFSYVQSGVVLPPVSMTGISVTSPPNKLNYKQGDSFDPSGMIVTAEYSDGTSLPVTAYTISPTGVLNVVGLHDITITYVESGVTRTTTITIDVGVGIPVPSITGTDVWSARNFSYGASDPHLTKEITMELADISVTDQFSNPIPITGISVVQSELDVINNAIDSMATEEGALGEYPLTLMTTSGGTCTLTITLKRYGAGTTDRYGASGTSTDHIVAQDMFYGLMESLEDEQDENNLVPLSEEVAKLRAGVAAYKGSDGSEIDIDDITVDTAQLIAFNTHIHDERGGDYRLTFYTPDGTSIEVTAVLRDKCMRSDEVPGIGSITANDCTAYDISMGELTTGDIIGDYYNYIRNINFRTTQYAMDRYGNYLDYSDITVDQDDLDEINTAIRNKDAKYMNEYIDVLSEYHKLHLSIADGADVRVYIRLYKEDNTYTDDKVGVASGTQKNIHLGVGGLQNPKRVTSYTDKWSGSHVYYGIYGGTPMIYRVLDKESTDYGSSTVLLDSAKVIDNQYFDTDGIANSGQTSIGSWDHSDLQSWMNGDGSGQFLVDFTDVEKDSIALSTKNTGSSHDGMSIPVLSWTPLNGDKVFALDAVESTNMNYGYVNYLYGEGRGKGGAPGSSIYYWLRSSGSSNPNHVGIVVSGGRINMGGGKILEDEATYGCVGASPAMNIKTDAVFMTSAVGTDKTVALSPIGADHTIDNTWKFTLKDIGKTIALQTGMQATINGSNIAIPYTYTGSNVSQISAMITDGDYTRSTSQLLYYGSLATSPAVTGTVTLTLPTGLPSGYKLYIIAEDVNGLYETDYASEPLEIITTAAMSSITVTAQPTKNTYKQGESFDPAGMIVTTVYSDGSSAQVSGYTITPSGALTTIGTQSITISYTENGITKVVTVPVTVIGVGGGSSSGGGGGSSSGGSGGSSSGGSGGSSSGGSGGSSSGGSSGSSSGGSGGSSSGGSGGSSSGGSKRRAGGTAGGSITTGTWQYNAIGWWYKNIDGSYPSSSWKLIGGKWYHFDASGYIEIGWKTYNGKSYYLSENTGAMATGWTHIDGKWYYMDASGAYDAGVQAVMGAKTSYSDDGAWIMTAEGWVYMENDGRKATGWKKIDNQWYYFNAKGTMQTGQITIAGKTYCLNEYSGHMLTGYVQYRDKTWHRFGTDGAQVE